MDLNHRKLLGTLEKLWSMTVKYASKFRLLIMSLDSLRGIAEIEKLGDTPPSDAAESHPIWVSLLLQLYKRLHGPRIACCFKTRNNEGIQRRWSVIVDNDIIYTTDQIPVF